MAKKTAKTKRPEPTLEVRFVAPGLAPEKIPLRAVSDVLAAVQDLASGRDPFETPHVPPEKSIGLVDVRRGSAIYRCVARAPEEALSNLGRIGSLLMSENGYGDDGDKLAAALGSIHDLSAVAKQVGCRLEVAIAGVRKEPLVVIQAEDYQRLSKRLLLAGETTVTGEVERVGGVTGLRCALRVPGRHRILYCDVKDRSLARRLGEHLYEDIVALGEAKWIYRSWRIYKFTINDFNQPRIGDSASAIENLRRAGLSAWDQIRNPEGYIREFRS
ncbi:MAG: hypothetical protein WD066_06935 [Planctomycetaceae bacterium]